MYKYNLAAMKTILAAMERILALCSNQQLADTINKLITTSHHLH
jgi:hypothetical protein